MADACSFNSSHCQVNHSLNHEPLDVLRRTAAEIMAAAVLERFPNVKLIGGQSTPVGFYYDFIFPFSFQKEFLILIEERMRLIIKEKRPIKTLEIIPDNAGALLDHHSQEIRAQLVRSQNDVLVRLFQVGDFIDFCCPPYLVDTGEIKAFKICEFSEEAREELGSFIRLYGAAFFEAQELKKFLKSDQSLKIKDHIELGKELDLFSPCREMGAGFWRWHPKGEFLRQELLKFWTEEMRNKNFEFTSTPRQYHLHRQYCPVAELSMSHIQLFSANFCANNQATVRLAECSFVQPPKSDKILCGMLDSQAYFRDQGHIFCAEEHLIEECISSLQFILKISKILSFEEYRLVLCSSSTYHKKHQASWKKSERLLIQTLRLSQLKYTVDEKAGVLHGPRIEVRIKDALGREWTGPFLGLDCVQSMQHIIIVLSMFSSMERTVALMLEKNEGVLPFWLAPEQVRVIAVNEQQAKYARDLSCTLQSLGIRVQVDQQNEKLSKRMYNAMFDHVPYAVVVGKREEQSRMATVRAYNRKETESMSLEMLVQKLTCLLKYGKSEFENQ